MKDALDLMNPSAAEITVNGAHVAAESLRLLEWLAFDGILIKCLMAFLSFQISDAIRLIGEANKIAAGLPATTNVNEGLAAFVVLAKLNELRYVDPALASPPPRETETVPRIENEMAVDLVSSLALRFSMNEIVSMTPEIALLYWQRVREDIAMSHNAIFYSTELGYRKQNVGKDRYKLVPRKSPYTPFWVRERESVGRPPPVVPRLVTHPENVIDGMSGQSLAELGEVSV